MKTSKALEPRIAGHPATAGGAECHESCADELIPVKQTHNGQPCLATGKARPTTVLNCTLNDPLERILPSRDTADAIIEAFFERVHPNYVLFHRGMFQMRYESLWNQKAGQRQDPEPGWICCLLMVLVFGAQALEDHGLDEANLIQKRYLKLVQGHVQHLIFTASLVNVQALLLLQLYEHNAGEHNAAWMLLGSASRMAVALGMHREGTGAGFDPIERNTRRIVWWTLYMFEQNSCIVLGRPSSIDHMEVDVQLPEETILDGGDHPPDYTAHALALTQIASRAKHILFNLSTMSVREADLLTTCESAKTLIKELDAWYSALPRYLRPEWQFVLARQRRAVLMMHVFYYHTKSIITRPCLLCKVNRNIDRLILDDNPPPPEITSDTYTLGQECRFAAKAAIDCLIKLSDFDLLDGVIWLDVYYVYHAVLVLCLDFLGRPQGMQESADDVAHRIAVTSILGIIQRKKLAPTYHILAQVAIQFARIVGILEEPAQMEEGRDPDNSEATIAPNQQPSVSDNNNNNITGISNVQGDGSGPGLLSDYLFQHGMNDLPWDFFNIDSSPCSDVENMSLLQLSAPYAGTFGEMYPFADA